jgi:hypothetical protein
MEEMRTILYMFRGKLEIEQAGRWVTLQRMTQLSGCTASVIYTLEPNGDLYYLGGNGLRCQADPKDTPEEIKLAAMLVN